MLTKETLKSECSRSETKGPYQTSFLELAALICTSSLVTTDSSKSTISLLETKTMSGLLDVDDILGGTVLGGLELAK